MKAYPEYKQCSIIWFNEIPKHWDSGQLKFRLSNNDGGVWGDDAEDEGTIVLRSTEIDLDGSWRIDNPAIRLLSDVEIEKALLKAGDLLITKSSGSEAHIGKTALVTPVVEALKACYSNFTQRIRPNAELDSRYLHYFLNSSLAREQYNYQSTTTTGLANLNAEIIANLRLPFIPIPEQQAIADFLDRKTAQIDTLIEKKQRQIDLLQEQRAALINHAVTKGLNPNVKMKDSGVEWLGEIPSHWKIVKLKYISPNITVGIVITPAKYYVDEGIPCLRSLNVKERKLLAENLVYISPESNELLQKSKIYSGDLVSVRTGQPGTTAVVDERFDGANCIDLIITRQSKEFDSQFLAYQLNSSLSKAQYTTGSSGAIQQHFNVETASNMLVVLPPLDEQIEIRKKLDLAEKRDENIADNIGLMIQYLQEYRTALISEAVTGKIDVR